MTDVVVVLSCQAASSNSLLNHSYPSQTLLSCLACCTKILRWICQVQCMAAEE
uniref:Uncharacterized protein n=1 Tax=Physcomitrium patens TaxID=3218 RepID=A0A2K1ILU9_PHYPA|nr:hypothetical protein PHYPA_026566 [Physcomitrium patens]